MLISHLCMKMKNGRVGGWQTNAKGIRTFLKAGKKKFGPKHIWESHATFEFKARNNLIS